MNVFKTLGLAPSAWILWMLVRLTARIEIICFCCVVFLFADWLYFSLSLSLSLCLSLSLSLFSLFSSLSLALSLSISLSLYIPMYICIYICIYICYAWCSNCFFASFLFPPPPPSFSEGGDFYRMPGVSIVQCLAVGQGTCQGMAMDQNFFEQKCAEVP